MSERVSPVEVTTAAWAAHEEAERTAAANSNLHSIIPLLQARRSVAERFPGCARAILNADADLNWDRGSFIADAIAKFRA
jgi:hypothetical protein